MPRRRNPPQDTKHNHEMPSAGEVAG
jgi:hypothetical protein